MSNTTSTVPTYTATFTLTQTGDGDDAVITPTLDLDPLVPAGTPDTPPVYIYMSGVALEFLRQAHILDEAGTPNEESALDTLERKAKQRSLN